MTSLNSAYPTSKKEISTINNLIENYEPTYTGDNSYPLG